ncbi:methyl-accepting chemotaxis protein [Gorillibacterium sp. CAU 1737]
MTKIEALLESLPYIQQLFREEVSLSLNDRTHVLYFTQTETLNFGLEAGSPLLPDYQDFKGLGGKRERVISYIPKEVLGTPFVAILIPVFEGDEIVALLGINYSMEKQAQLEAITQQANHSISSLLSAIEQVAAQSEELSATSEQIRKNTQRAVEDSSSVAEVTSIIRSVSEQTNLLGLNALIEAARIGEAGAGFGVVAKEVRKLSEHTKEAAVHIEESVSRVQQAIRTMEEEVNQISQATSEQAQMIAHFVENVQMLNETSEKLKSLVQEMLMQ